MTAIQNERNKNRESERHNRAAEEDARNKTRETVRHNKATMALEADNLAFKKHDAQRSANLKYKDLEQQKQIAREKNATTIAAATIKGLSNIKPSVNDPQWYVPNSGVADRILSLPFADPIGTLYPKLTTGATTVAIGWSGIDGDINALSSSSVGAPTVLTMQTIPTIGVATEDSAINRAADNVWMKINEKNGRNSAYEPSDIIMYQIGVASHIALYHFILKLRNWLRAYNEGDMTMPRAIVEAMGFNFDDLQDHYYDLDNILLNYKAWLKPYRILPEFELYKRWAFAYGTVLIDADSDYRTQYYQYTPSYLYKLNVSGESTRLDPIQVQPFGGANFFAPTSTFADIKTIVDTLKDGFFGAQDIKIMNADITAYYSSVSASEVLSDADNPVIAYGDRELYQFKNAYFSDEISGAPTIYQTTSTTGRSYVASTPVSLTNNYGFSEEWIVELPDGKHSAEDIIEATRLTVAQAYNGESYFTELPHGLVMTIFTNDYNGAFLDSGSIHHYVCKVPSKFSRLIGSDVSPSDSAVIVALFSRLVAQNAFKYCPNFVWFAGVRTYVDGTARVFTMPINTFSWEEYVAITPERLVAANNTVAMHMFGLDV